jgi:hypothetical protein
MKDHEPTPCSMPINSKRTLTSCVSVLLPDVGPVPELVNVKVGMGCSTGAMATIERAMLLREYR